MPNWCDNYLEVQHKNPEEIDKLVAALEAGELFNSIIPIGEWEYDKAIAAWGTKWDAEAGEVDSRVERHTPNNCVISFQTAWSPPVQVYEKLPSMGFTYAAHWFEPGCLVAGSSIDGETEDYDIEELDDSLLDELPSDFLYVFGETIASLLSEGDHGYNDDEEEED